MEDTIKTLRLIIPLMTYRKIMAYIRLCETEVTGFAEVEYNPAQNAFIAGEVYLLDQEAGGQHVEMDEEIVSKFNLEYIKKGGTQLPRIWWHSHVDMAAFFSAVDEQTLEELQNESFIIAVVGNKRAEMKAKCYIANNIPMFGEQQYIEVDPLTINLAIEYENIPEMLKKEVEKKVKKKEYRIQHSTQRSYLQDGRQKKPQIKGALTLPKDPQEAQNRIDALELEKRWSYELDDWKWVDPRNGQVWVDTWGSIERFGGQRNDDNLDDEGNETEVFKKGSLDINTMLEDMENRRMLEEEKEAIMSDDDIEKGIKN